MAAQDRRRGLIDHFLLRLSTIPWSNQAADHFGMIKDLHQRQGTPIGELAEKLIFLTHHTRHFEVPDLKREDWMV